MKLLIDRQKCYIDARSPAEFEQGRIPGAINIPLLNNEERAAVGTCYKQQGQAAAVELGFKLAGPQFVTFIQEAKKIEQPIVVYCWRGGLRSQTMAWILTTAGMSVEVYEGGYKAFRREALHQLKQPRNIHLLGGLTGSGKTEQLEKLRQHGEQVLDLEDIACHRGSSFGMIGMPDQPSCEQFENEIALQWSRFSFNKPVWIEDESRMIGKCKIPDALYQYMQQGRFYWLEATREERLQRIVKDYGKAHKDVLILATMRLTKKLGTERAKMIVSHLNEQKIREAFDLLLDYYDHTYTHTLKKRKKERDSQPESLETLISI